jgi:hypothetical protein
MVCLLEKEHIMPMDVALALVLITTPFIIFGIALAYADRQTRQQLKK